MRTTQLPDPRETWTSKDARILLEELRSTGESVAAFGRRNGIDPARLYWWRKRLATSSESLTLIPALVTSDVAAITIRLPNGIAIEIASSSPSVVAAIVNELTRTQS